MQALLNHKQAKKNNKGKRQTLHNPSISDDHHQAQYFSIVDSHGVNININQFAAASPKKPKPKPEETDDMSGRGDAGERSGKGGIARRHTPGARGAALQICAAGAKEGATKGRYR